MVQGPGDCTTASSTHAPSAASGTKSWMVSDMLASWMHPVQGLAALFLGGLMVHVVFTNRGTPIWIPRQTLKLNNRYYGDPKKGPLILGNLLPAQSFKPNSPAPENILILNLKPLAAPLLAIRENFERYLTLQALAQAHTFRRILWIPIWTIA